MQQEKLLLKKRNILKFYIVMIGGLLLLLINIAIARNTSQFYYPSITSEGTQFFIESPEITGFLVKKNILKNKSTLKIKVVKKNSGNIDLIILTEEKLSFSMKKIIEKTFKKKIDLVLGDNLSSWTHGYHLMKNNKNHKIYLDKTGILKKSNISISKKNHTMTIEEKQPIGTKRTVIDFYYPFWSKGLAVIQKVTQISFEGSQTIRTKMNLVYKKTNLGQYFLSEIRSKSTHGVNFESTNLVKREIQESFLITSYKKLP